MKKSADITKYDPDWQMVRVKVKGPATALEDKLRIVSQYFEQYRTVDAWERVVNWLQGLQMGYRSSGDTPVLQRIAIELARYNGIQPTAKQADLSPDQILSKLKMYPYSERLLLWRDLYERNKKWLAKGYVHKEHNDFTDLLYKTFEANHEQVPSNYSLEKLNDMRNKSASIKNTHKFFF